MTSPQQVPYLDGTLHIPDKYIPTTVLRNTDPVNGANITNQPISAGPSGSVGYVDYDSISSTYPVRPTSRTDIKIFWFGPVPPTIGGLYALDNKDQWINTTP